MNLKEKVICFKNKVQRKALPVVASATAAISAVVVTVSAEEAGASSSMMTSLTNAIKTGFTDVINNCIDVAVMIIPLGLGLYGMGKVWDVAKKFFTKSTS